MTKLLIGLGVLIVIGALFSALQALRDKLFPREELPGETGAAHGMGQLRAVVHCTGGGVGFLKYNYQGARDCLAASRLPGGGPLGCDYGCLGMGSCELVCPTGAIQVREGVAVVDGERCTACGKCVEACPRHIISLERYEPKQHVSVPCASREKEETVSKLCADGCVGCSLCVSACPREAITVEEGLARIDYEKCDHCGLCAKKCPRRLIRVERVEELPEPEPPKPPRERRKPKRVKPALQLPQRKKGRKSGEKEASPEKPGEEKEDLSLEGEPTEDLLTGTETPETAEIPAGEELSPETGGGEQTRPGEPPSAPEPTGEEEPSPKGEEKRTSAEEAFQAFAQAVAAAGEALDGQGEEGPKSEE